MGKIIQIKVVETYEIPDEWEIVKNDENVEIIKVNDKEFLDFGIIPFKSDQMYNQPLWTMLSADEYGELQETKLNTLTMDTEINYLTDETKRKELEELFSLNEDSEDS